MDRNEIADLAKGMVPFVRECVSEAFAKAALPPELAEQVAAAVRLLHESPPLSPAPAKAGERAAPPPMPSPRVARIERDEEGNFVPIYDER